jgi:spore coat-associated protein N
MSRLEVFRRHPKRTLTALAAVLAAVGVAIGSGADFTASSTNTGNSVSAGTLSMSNSKDGTSFLTVSGLKPGSAGTPNTVDIKNTGSISGVFTLAKGTVTDGGNTDPKTFPFSGVVNIKIEDCGKFVGATPPSCSSNTTLYNGTLADMGTTGKEISSLGTYAANDQHRYQFTASLDKSVGDAYQAGSSTVTFNWSAVQS